MADPIFQRDRTDRRSGRKRRRGSDAAGAILLDESRFRGRDDVCYCVEKEKKFYHVKDIQAAVGPYAIDLLLDMKEIPLVDCFVLVKEFHVEIDAHEESCIADTERYTDCVINCVIISAEGSPPGIKLKLGTNSAQIIRVALLQPREIRSYFIRCNGERSITVLI